MTTHPRMVQVLCGPERHAIFAMAYEPGLTAAQKDSGGCSDITLTEENALEYMKGMLDGLIERRGFDPWCDICRSKRERWIFEDRALKFRTLAEAMPSLRESARRQHETAAFIKASRG